MIGLEHINIDAEVEMLLNKLEEKRIKEEMDKKSLISTPDYQLLMEYQVYSDTEMAFDNIPDSFEEFVKKRRYEQFN